MLVPSYDDGDNDMAGRHTDCADCEYRFAAYFVDVQHRGNGRKKHDDADYPGGKERDSVGGEAERCKDGRSVVEYSIHARPLLEKHCHSCHNNTSKHSLGPEQTPNSHKLQLEGVPSREFAQSRPVLSHRPFLEEGLRFDLQELQLDEFVIQW